MTEAVKLDKGKKAVFKEKLMNKLPNGVNLNTCLTCGACASGCPATGLRDMDPRKFVRMVALGMDEELHMHPWVWLCSQCQRCVYVCPMNIDIAAMVFEARASWPREERPKGILGSCDMAMRNTSGSAMGISEEDFEWVVGDILDEVHENQPGWEDLEAPVNKEGAHFFLSQNSREPGTEPEEMIPLWKILHIVGADWTYGTRGWGGENYCMFLADDESWEKTARNSIESAKELGCKVYLNTECGHATYAIWKGQQKYNIDKTGLEIAPIVPYYAKWIREGKLKPNSDWNKDLKIKFTCQDPCQQVRKSFGDPLADDLRFVIKACVGEENFIDMVPNHSNNFCCGGGGGYLQSGYNEERLKYGEIKKDQILATGADYCVTPCHNCHDQVHKLADHYECKYHTIHLWTLIAFSLGVLGATERLYLGPDLKALNMPEGQELEDEY
ncbi:(Fe-S)-binding protein [Desulfobacter postgatei]|jgi:Fe-S oxidoreductase|uniref:(Fe-S)-binding protein n=1 Tax=Desulfobacter postgatei TaxID=2293 RepID=UPI002A36B7B3|nr:(Fe-S)-binding protein [Desulfobacter postgatei]MDX9964952.1 (Fe-S)-binding protein [Desulfobacter postgatei]